MAPCVRGMLIIDFKTVLGTDLLWNYRNILLFPAVFINQADLFLQERAMIWSIIRMTNYMLYCNVFTGKHAICKFSTL